MTKEKVVVALQISKPALLEKTSSRLFNHNAPKTEKIPLMRGRTEKKKTLEKKTARFVRL
jgi:hypothetical protein